jgi:hypothetical protein
VKFVVLLKAVGGWFFRPGREVDWAFDLTLSEWLAVYDVSRTGCDGFKFDLRLAILQVCDVGHSPDVCNISSAISCSFMFQSRFDILGILDCYMFNFSMPTGS